MEDAVPRQKDGSHAKIELRRRLNKEIACNVVPQLHLGIKISLRVHFSIFLLFKSLRIKTQEAYSISKRVLLTKYKLIYGTHTIQIHNDLETITLIAARLHKIALFFLTETDAKNRDR